MKHQSHRVGEVNEGISTRGLVGGPSDPAGCPTATTDACDPTDPLTAPSPPQMAGGLNRFQATPPPSALGFGLDLGGGGDQGGHHRAV